MSPLSTYDIAGFLLFGFVFGAIVMAMIAVAVKEFRKRKRPTADRSIKANPTEFEKIGNWAIGYQYMVSFVYETRDGELEEIIKE